MGNHRISRINGMGKENLPWWGARFYLERLNSCLKAWTNHQFLGTSLSGRFLLPVPEKFLAEWWQWSARCWEPWSWHQVLGGKIWISHFHQVLMWLQWESHLESFRFIQLCQTGTPAQEQIPTWIQRQAWPMELIFGPVFVEIWGIYIQGMASWLPVTEEFAKGGETGFLAPFCVNYLSLIQAEHRCTWSWDTPERKHLDFKFSLLLVFL